MMRERYQVLITFIANSLRKTLATVYNVYEFWHHYGQSDGKNFWS